MFRAAGTVPPGFGPAGTDVVRADQRATSSTPSRASISNLIVDQTSTNPAAIAAAGFPVRTQGNPGVVPCTTDPDPLADPPVDADPAGLHARTRRCSSPT